ncbi:MAG: RDD family protein [Beijerinckiaceae bacterium]|jgi:uncharacterized RDD family membrane protein YckC|nr:RDD family protein [Beijerinckiaceae bacterium]
MTSHLPARSGSSEARAVSLGQRTAGVLMPRLVAYVVDLFIVGLISLIVAMSVSFLGLITFGIGWMLFPIVGICTAMAYAAITIGGAAQATIGMRVSGIRVERGDGGPPDGITAAAHCLLFYVATFTVGLFLLTVTIGLLRRDGRMGHDLLTGLVLVRN